MDLGKITPDDLIALLNLFGPFEQRFNEMRNLFRERPDVFATSGSLKPSWYELYEMPFADHLARVVVLTGQAEKAKELAAEKNPQRATIEYTQHVLENFDNDDEDGPFDEEHRPLLQYIFGLSASLYFSYKSLLVYGSYLNELIEIVGLDRKLGDKALFQAIKIDPTVMACHNVVNRVSQAMIENDTKFLSTLRNSLLGKLTKREDKTYQKQRYVLQVLHELGTPNLNQEQLYELFVKQMNIVAKDREGDVGDVANNLRQFAYQFIKGKSVRQK